METLLFKESPYIAFGFSFIALLFYYNSYNRLFGLSLLVLLILVIFYRYTPYNERHKDNTIISPAQGLVTNIIKKAGRINVSIYLNIANNHTQIYPVNGKVINRYYDRSGVFNLVVDMDKSRHNEKKIHTIKMKDGKIIYVTQIAGYFPRCIASSDKVPENVKAGEYMGIIKFGSRVDISFPGDLDLVKVKLNDKINHGDIIYEY